VLLRQQQQDNVLFSAGLWIEVVSKFEAGTSWLLGEHYQGFERSRMSCEELTGICKSAENKSFVLEATAVWTERHQ